ncbi:MBL fold metallo-hydrolase [Lujinxingia litoralis]|uniref:MBL fold metallo-hydrolase n=1 Tax=Lujinxingia litoralis TaxID=2211119 RepID=A0A328C9F8_9DELT|nr:MBL fold metallo-hydrolase [Lujinxingia litoralis]RAL23966.1 MBL fold metallo-hydrolase [Lujinxingia litoralis]
MSTNLKIQPFYDARTYTLTYVVYDPQTRDAVLIDPVLDYEPHASAMWTESADRAVNFLKEHKLNLHYILETHAHADHLSGAQHVKVHYPKARLAIGARITEVQTIFKQVYNLPESFPTDGSQFDLLLEEGEVLEAGSIKIETIYTPGHTPACSTFHIDDAVFTGDTIFMPDFGTGRCDFPGGSSQAMYDSITNKLYSLPDETRVFVGHDYQPGGRDVAFMTTIAEQKASNVQLPQGRSEKEFVEMRDGRDKTLAAPKLLLQSLQVNIDAGSLPQPEANEKRYLRIPVNVFRPASTPDADLTLEEV